MHKIIWMSDRGKACDWLEEKLRLYWSSKGENKTEDQLQQYEWPTVSSFRSLCKHVVLSLRVALLRVV